MSKKTRKEKKALERKEIAKQRVVARRNVIRAEAKKDKQEQEKENAYTQKLRPIRNSFVLAEDVPPKEKVKGTFHPGNGTKEENLPSFKQLKDQMIIEKLKHNQEILKAIEAEFQAERADREKAKENVNEIIEQATIKPTQEHT